MELTNKIRRGIIVTVAAVTTGTLIVISCAFMSYWAIGFTIGFGVLYWIMTKEMINSRIEKKSEAFAQILAHGAFSSLVCFMCAAIADVNCSLVPIFGAIAAFMFLFAFTAIIAVNKIPKEYVGLIYGCELFLVALCVMIINTVVNIPILEFLTNTMIVLILVLFVSNCLYLLAKSIYQYCKH